MEMYVSGMVAAFIFCFIVYFTQGIQRRRIERSSEESTARIIFGALVGSTLASLLSWLAVVILVFLFMSGKVWGISK